MFNYDWFTGGGLERQVQEAKTRCAMKKYPGHDRAKKGNGSKAFDEYRNQLETRIVLYLRDGLSYEMREIVNIGMHSALSFECVPVDENYQVGAYVIVVPFEDIARVEVFAVHPDDKPQEQIRIPGFKAGAMEVPE